MSYDKVLLCYVDMMTYELCENSMNMNIFTFIYVSYDYGKRMYVRGVAWKWNIAFGMVMGSKVFIALVWL